MRHIVILLGVAIALVGWLSASPSTASTVTGPGVAPAVSPPHAASMNPAQLAKIRADFNDRMSAASPATAQKFETLIDSLQTSLGKGTLTDGKTQIYQIFPNTTPVREAVIRVTGFEGLIVRISQATAMPIPSPSPFQEQLQLQQLMQKLSQYQAIEEEILKKSNETAKQIIDSLGR